jgi:hypothetical protein
MFAEGPSICTGVHSVHYECIIYWSILTYSAVFEDLNISYECSCGFDLDKHILYIEDVYKGKYNNKNVDIKFIEHDAFPE